MTKSQIVKMRNLFVSSKLTYEIVLDNEHKYTSQDHLLWKDAEETLICIRVNPDFNAPNPVEIYVTAYEHIQGIVTAVDKDSLNKVLTGLAVPDKAAIIKDLDDKGILSNRNSMHMQKPTSYLGINER